MQSQSEKDRPQPANHLEGCKKLADDLEQEFVQPALQKHLRTIKDKAAAVGDKRWPQALWSMPEAEAEPIWNAMRVREASGSLRLPVLCVGLCSRMLLLTDCRQKHCGFNLAALLPQGQGQGRG